MLLNTLEKGEGEGRGEEIEKEKEKEKRDLCVLTEAELHAVDVDGVSRDGAAVPAAPHGPVRRPPRLIDKTGDRE